MVRDEGIGGGASSVPLEEAVEERGFLGEGSGFCFGNVCHIEGADWGTDGTKEGQVSESDLKRS